MPFRALSSSAVNGRHQASAWSCRWTAGSVSTLQDSLDLVRPVELLLSKVPSGFQSVALRPLSTRCPNCFHGVLGFRVRDTWDGLHPLNRAFTAVGRVAVAAELPFPSL